MPGWSEREFFGLRNLVFVCLFAVFLKVGSGGSDLQSRRGPAQADREQGRAEGALVVTAGHRDVSHT